MAARTAVPTTIGNSSSAGHQHGERGGTALPAARRLRVGAVAEATGDGVQAPRRGWRGAAVGGGRGAGDRVLRGVARAAGRAGGGPVRHGGRGADRGRGARSLRRLSGPAHRHAAGPRGGGARRPVSYAENGRLVASVDWSYPGHGDGDDPEELEPYLDGLGFGEDGDPRPKALAFLQRCGGVRITREHLVDAHPASVLVPADLFEPRGRLGSLLPGGADLVKLVGLPLRFESVRSPLLRKACRGAVEVAVDGLLPAEALTVDPSALTDADRELRRAEALESARRGYRRGVEDAWARYEVDGAGPVGGAAGKSGSALVRATFAHAVARGRLHAEPSTALTQVLVNAAKVDPDGTAARRERVHAHLSGFAARSGE
ncbi:DUF6461 domain-containing protein [Micromonospora sp. NPDC007220]|uniref:DUF6461 domain-containing protein n=1 Tax=Micromonospora sp. NPDC007220 TaxID=3154318 RepID=UPI0033E8957E